ncbi:MAG: class II glutamine amidotransferase [Gammaproteobacteria bacterium]|jgi:glutamine amidotransferase
MCRLAAYLGPEITLQQFLLDPPHGLYVQSRAPRELVYAKFNADGYGFGWYSPDGRTATYTSAMPIWSDRNLPALGRSLCSGLWVAEVRSATDGSPTHAYNTQPFSSSRLLFVHNGYIGDFNHVARPEIMRRLSPEIAANLYGNTDSEYLFACLCQLLDEDEDLTMTAAIRRLFALIAGWCGERQALLNLVVSDGDRVYAARHGLNHPAPSLYFTTDDSLFPGGQLVASERFTEDGAWQAVPEHHLLTLEHDRPPELGAL